MPKGQLQVAIVGGGLCGLALAIALEKRNVSYTIYEARASFTEIGAGINLGPNTIHSFNAIDPSLSEKIFALATRNEPGREDVWMNLRLGAPTNNFEDARFIAAIQAPPTGNMTVSRNELLQLLASSIQPDRAKFNKKLTDIHQSSSGIRLFFADGTNEESTVLIGCDGAHSAVRALMLGSDHPASGPRFSHMGGYRAVFPMEIHEQAVGVDKAHMSHIWLGPGGYIIMYPIDGGRNVNIGFWIGGHEEWNNNSWILQHQKAQMLKDFEAWGPTVQRLMNLTSDDTQFWATFHHAVQPEHYFNGRICLIGDSAHSMPPHVGQGAAQSMEDACVMGDVLQRVQNLDAAVLSIEQVEAAFLGFEAARKERFEAVVRTSVKAFEVWADFWRMDLTKEDLDRFESDLPARFQWLWDENIANQQNRAVAETDNLLRSSRAAPLNVNSLTTS